MVQEGKSDSTDALRYERNRFVAFAFASADAFLETDLDLQVLYGTGAIKGLMGIGEEAMLGTNFADAVIQRDRARMRAMAVTAKTTGRAGPVALAPVTEGAADLVELGVTFLPNRSGRLYFTLRKLNAREQRSHRPTDSEAGGLMNVEDFTSLACDIASQGRDGGTATMTLLDITGLDTLEASLDAKAAQELMDDVAAHLQINAIGGAAARLSGDRYGVVHKSDLDIAALSGSLTTLAKDSDPNGKGVSVGSHQFDLEDQELSETDLAKAVIYTISQFAEQSGEFTVTDLKASYAGMLDQTRGKIAVFRKMIANQQFDVAFQPIVDLATRGVHHYEALVRMKGKDAGASPFETITFAEGAGVIQEFDLAMCRRILWDLEAIEDPQMTIAVNLSGRSLQTPSFVENLSKLLKKNESYRQGLMFEITESTRIENLEETNKIVQELRDLGHKVCLDDFGAGAAAFQYLRALQVDCVKIDGIYVLESNHNKKSQAFLRSIVSLCRDLDIETVGEMIETEDTARYLQKLGVHYGQGYHFGRPEIGLSQLQTRSTSAA